MKGKIPTKDQDPMATICKVDFAYCFLVKKKKNPEIIGFKNIILRPAEHTYLKS